MANDPKQMLLFYLHADYVVKNNQKISETNNFSIRLAKNETLELGNNAEVIITNNSFNIEDEQNCTFLRYIVTIFFSLLS